GKAAALTRAYPWRCRSDAAATLRRCAPRAGWRREPRERRHGRERHDISDELQLGRAVGVPDERVQHATDDAVLRQPGRTVPQLAAEPVDHAGGVEILHRLR